MGKEEYKELIVKLLDGADINVLVSIYSFIEGMQSNEKECKE